MRTNSCGTTRPAPQGQVPDFRVAHLSCWQAHGPTRSLQQGVGIGSPKAIQDRGFRSQHRVAIESIPITPAIQDHQNHRCYRLRIHEMASRFI